MYDASQSHSIIEPKSPRKDNSSRNKAEAPHDQTDLPILINRRKQSLLIGGRTQNQTGFHMYLGLGNDASPVHQRKLNRDKPYYSMEMRKSALQNFLCPLGVSIYIVIRPAIPVPHNCDCPRPWSIPNPCSRFLSSPRSLSLGLALSRLLSTNIIKLFPVHTTLW